MIIAGACAFVALVIVLSNFVLVKQAEVMVIERLGKFKRILGPGLYWLTPFIDQKRITIWTSTYFDTRANNYVSYTKFSDRIDVREAVFDFPKQNVITKDNVRIEINALLYYQITDAKAAVYEVVNLPEAIEKLTQTTLRNVIGSLDLDETLISRDAINEKLRIILDDATHKWGVKINRVELQEVNPPADICIAMEKQMRAERDRRAVILEAEGSKRAVILEAEGAREADVLTAQGQAQARLIQAQAESEAVKLITSALPAKADPIPYLVAVRYIQAFSEMTQGKDNKIVIVPYEATSLAGAVSAIKSVFEHVGPKN
jgi:regulator of protease activity HflC (stomatin/prohibitin superfamily)